MADMAREVAVDEMGASPWRGLWVGLAALFCSLALIGLIFMITSSNRARDEALGLERRTYEVMLLTRTIDAAIARSEAALGRYVLDEDQDTGTAYYNEWRRAGFQIEQLRRLLRSDPGQTRRVAELRRLFEARNAELGPAASAAERREGTGGLSILYRAASSPTLPALRLQLERIAASARENLQGRTRQTQVFVNRADTYTDWLGWLAVLIGIGAAALAFLTYRALREGVAARKEAESEAWRALDLDRAVQQRTRELRDANERLKAEAAERAAAEAKLRQVQKMEAVGQLTGGIAHDFNNMLAVIVGGLDLAKRRLQGPRREVEFHLDNALEGATRAAALTRRLLAFARAEPLLAESMVPAERLDNMLALIDRALGDRINVHTRFPDKNWQVSVDPLQLENAILNLAVNARDAMKGKGDLTIEVANVEVGPGEIDDLPEGEFVRIEVADTGCGIPPEQLERVFEPFYTTKPLGKGTGLGLTQIFGFARQSGGHVTIDSRPGKGTRVAIYLPRSDRPGDAAAPVPARALPVSDPVSTHPGARILVVEDDPRVARSTVGALEELGYRPVACAGGREALQRLDDDPDVDLVVTDVMMPEMTGPELAVEIRRTRPFLPILFVTGYVGEAGEAADLAGGEVLRKPFTVASLAHSVEAALADRPPVAVTGSPHASTDEAAE